MATNNQEIADDHEQRLDTFEHLVSLIKVALGEFGFQDTYNGDYSIYEDYWGYPQVKVSIAELKMLQPIVVDKLHQLIKAYPGWEIVVAVVHRDNYGDWPDMGLYIRPGQIIDGLQRQYFPKEFQDIEYEGARLGTVDD